MRLEELGRLGTRLLVGTVEALLFNHEFMLQHIFVQFGATKMQKHPEETRQRRHDVTIHFNLLPIPSIYGWHIYPHLP